MYLPKQVFVVQYKAIERVPHKMRSFVRAQHKRHLPVFCGLIWRGRKDSWVFSLHTCNKGSCLLRAGLRYPSTSSSPASSQGETEARGTGQVTKSTDSDRQNLGRWAQPTRPPHPAY